MCFPTQVQCPQRPGEVSPGAGVTILWGCWELNLGFPQDNMLITGAISPASFSPFLNRTLCFKLDPRLKTQGKHLSFPELAEASSLVLFLFEAVLYTLSQFQSFKIIAIILPLPPKQLQEVTSLC